MRVSGRFTKSSTVESGLERPLASAAIAPSKCSLRLWSLCQADHCRVQGMVSTLPEQHDTEKEWQEIDITDLATKKVSKAAGETAEKPRN